MSSSQKKSKSLMRGAALLLPFVPLALGACTANTGPHPMPTGYTYHAKEYKAPPGPEPVVRKWVEERKEMIASFNQPDQPRYNDDPEVSGIEMVKPVPAYEPAPEMPVSAAQDLALWQAAADDLLGRLFADFGQPTEAIYIQPQTTPNPHFETALRQSLSDRGLPVAVTPGMGPFALKYTVSPPSYVNDGRMLLILSLEAGQQTAAEQSGLYDVTGTAGAYDAGYPAGTGAPMPISPSEYGADEY